ncbi:tRNA threonylcarbamoyladenosine dehydratase [Solitalea canadensis]|uniref:Dinucleotide-utilizing enzyme possibly involved in molybdopterin or thiamin biosynthesis n=1 Tax=Solitalea canadensis (strain ATCC 29591 / DSM 3403 / JCM 21819 / LMG 8368 / NBRC 15130 / NCIMB 12057 / USAM 9D) TaxID=929556 RepID=H8KTI2_SOLCM|nr:tRNA threonylcarbamoyladenosine dehydratase [Solitalea canadensis]AFD06440.1 dinucleotide-utilizing enzyme possibly involved in molybdopterin or thiamin biosynthesis [Solitalea canadensis DSM 3403]
MEVPYWMSRTNLLLGEEKIEKLVNSHVLVVGLGGVGGICAEMIARAGVGKMTIVDADTVDPSNRNRQIPATKSTEGKLKAEVLADRIRDINPEIDLTVLCEYLRDERMFEVLDSNNFDYAVDCIDTLAPKLFFIKGCKERGLPLISSMGAGGKVDPTRVRVVDLFDTYNCTLSKHVRKRLRQMGVKEDIKVVWSPEDIDPTRVVPMQGTNKSSIIGTISYMPAVFGCTVASVVIRDLYNR